MALIYFQNSNPCRVQALEIISVKRDCRSDTISKIVSNTDAAENSWSLERTNQTTTTNGRTFGSSNSHTTNDEKSFEESKNLSIENTISKINTSGNSYQINQSIIILSMTNAIPILLHQKLKLKLLYGLA